MKPPYTPTPPPPYIRRSLLHNSSVASHSFTDDGFAVLLKRTDYEVASEYELLVGLFNSGLASAECQSTIYLGGNPIVHLVKSSAYSAGRLYSEVAVSTTTGPMLAYVDLQGEDGEAALLTLAHQPGGHADTLFYCSVGDSLWAVTQGCLLQWSLSQPLRDPSRFSLLQGARYFPSLDGANCGEFQPEIKGMAANTNGVVVGVNCSTETGMNSELLLFDLDGDIQDHVPLSESVIKVFADDGYFWAVTSNGVQQFKVATYADGRPCLVSVFKDTGGLPHLCATAKDNLLYIGFDSGDPDKNGKTALQMIEEEIHAAPSQDDSQTYKDEFHKPQVPTEGLLDVHVNGGYAYFLYKNSDIFGYPLDRSSLTKPE